MPEASLGQKISWFMYQKGLSAIAKPDYLVMTKFADDEWFKIAEALIKDNKLVKWIYTGSREPVQ